MARFCKLIYRTTLVVIVINVNKYYTFTMIKKDRQCIAVSGVAKSRSKMKVYVVERKLVRNT